MGSVMLHELYFVNLGGAGKIPAVIAVALETHFGEVSRWRREFVGPARSLAGGPGWAVLSYSRYDGQFYNHFALDGSQAIVSAAPILGLDMCEHACHIEFGAYAAAYIDTFIRLMDWTVAADRLMSATSDGQPRGEGPGGERLPSISVEALRTVMHSEHPPQVVAARLRNYVSKNPDTIPNAVWRDSERHRERVGELSKSAPVIVFCVYGFRVGCETAAALCDSGLDAKLHAGPPVSLEGDRRPSRPPWPWGRRRTESCCLHCRVLAGVARRPRRWHSPSWGVAAPGRSTIRR